jgi:small subunit ribosomal protein S1
MNEEMPTTTQEIAQIPAPEHELSLPVPEHVESLPAPQAQESLPAAPEPSIEPEPVPERAHALEAAPSPGEPPSPETPAPEDPKLKAAQEAAAAGRKAAAERWDRLVEAHKNGETVHALVTAPVKGGLLVEVSGYRGFLPASQSGIAKGAPLESLVKTTLPLKVIDVDHGRKRVVVSHRRAQQEERRHARQELIRSLQVGEEREATVLRLTDFGAFVDIGCGVDALVPASELAFERVKSPADVVHIGEKLNVRILRVEQGGKKIAASRKGALRDPWREHGDVLKQGKTVEGKVVGKDRRLDVEIAPGITGSISDREVNPEDYEIGETIEVTVRSVDFRNRRLRLGNPHAAAAAARTTTGFAPLGVELGR